MPRYIDADALHKAYMELRNFKQDPQSGDWISLRAVSLTTVIRMLNEAPTIDAVEVVRGEWVEQDDCWQCSNCGDEYVLEVDVKPIDAKMYFCPNCGAKMKGADDE